MNLYIYGDIPKQHPAEEYQFRRVIEELKKHRDNDWGVLIIDIPYQHKKGSVIEYDYDWNGQIDMLLLCENKIVIYELKGYTAKLRHATTNETEWIIENLSGKIITSKSFFIQVSKCRAFILSESLPEFFKEKINDNHWIVDGRLVFKDSSDLSKFFQKIPKTIKHEQYEEMLDKIENQHDIELFKRFYSDIEQETGKHQSIIVSKSDYGRMFYIYKYTNTEIRTAKWFKVIKEKEIIEDLCKLNYTRFKINLSDAINYGKYLKERYV